MSEQTKPNETVEIPEVLIRHIQRKAEYEEWWAWLKKEGNVKPRSRKRARA